MENISFLNILQTMAKASRAVVRDDFAGRAAKYCIRFNSGIMPADCQELDAALRLLCVRFADNCNAITGMDVDIRELTAAVVCIFCSCNDAHDAEADADVVVTSLGFHYVKQLLLLQPTCRDAYCTRIITEAASVGAGTSRGRLTTAIVALNVLVQLIRQEGDARHIRTMLVSDEPLMARLLALTTSAPKIKQQARVLALWVLQNIVYDSSVMSLAKILHFDLVKATLVATCDSDVGIVVMASCCMSLMARNHALLRSEILKSNDARTALHDMLQSESSVLQHAAIFTLSTLFAGGVKLLVGDEFDAIGYKLLCIIACPETTLELSSFSARALHGIAHTCGNTNHFGDYACLLPTLMVLIQRSMCVGNVQAGEDFARLVDYIYYTMNPAMLCWITAAEIRIVVAMLREDGCIGMTASRIVIALYGTAHSPVAPYNCDSTRVVDMLDYHGVPAACFDSLKAIFSKTECCDSLALRRACASLASLIRLGRCSDKWPRSRVQAMVSLGAPALLVAIIKAPGSKLDTSAHATRGSALSALASILQLHPGSLDEFIDDQEFIDVLHRMVLSESVKPRKFTTRVRWMLQALVGVQREEYWRGQDAMLSLLIVKPLFEHGTDECVICRGNNADADEPIRAMGVVHCAHCNVQVHKMCIREWVRSRTKAADSCTNCQCSFTRKILDLWNGTITISVEKL